MTVLDGLRRSSMVEETPRLHVRRLWALQVLACIGWCASCASSGPTAVYREIERLERARFAAMTRQDVQALAPMLAEDLLYCHSDGSCEDKAQFLETIRSGRIRYLAMQPEALRPRDVSGVVVVSGTVAIEGEIAGQQRSFRITFTDVYSQRDGRWQLVAWQSTRVP